MSASKIFSVTCPSCGRSFIASWELRFSKLRLWCPFCDHRFRVDEAAKIDEQI